MQSLNHVSLLVRLEERKSRYHINTAGSECIRQLWIYSDTEVLIDCNLID